MGAMDEKITNKNAMLNARDLSFDYIKGVLIFLVVLGHVVTYIPYSDFSDNWLFTFIYSFHMPLFVFITGFFFASAKNASTGTLLSRKAVRLLLPHFSYSVFMLLIVFLFYPYFNKVIYDGDIVSKFKIYHVVFTSLWFLWCVFLCSVIINLIFNYILKPWLFCIILCAMMLGVYNYLPHKVFKDMQLVIQMPFFLLGMYYKENRERIDKYGGVIFGIVLVGYLLLYRDTVVESPYYKVLLFMFSVPLFFILLSKMYRYKVITPLFCFLGKASLGIYVFHLLLMILTRDNTFYDFKIGIGNNGQQYWMSLFISVVVCCFISWLVVQLRKSRFLKFIFLGER